MPRALGRQGRDGWTGLGDMYVYLADFMAAVAVWGAIGFGLDRLFKTWPILFVSGVVMGHVWGVWLLWMRMRKWGERTTDGGPSGEANER